ncbi:MAG TPA: hypothetical protein VIM86_01635 [Thermodesulfobacteriota bacterium]
MTTRVLALATAGALLWAAPAAGMVAAPELGQPRTSEPEVTEPPGAPDRFEAEPPIDDQVLLQYAQALSGLLRVAEMARQGELEALREAGLTEEEFVALSERVLTDPGMRRRLEEHLAREMHGDGTLASLQTGRTPRR